MNRQKDNYIRVGDKMKFNDSSDVVTCIEANSHQVKSSGGHWYDREGTIKIFDTQTEYEKMQDEAFKWWMNLREQTCHDLRDKYYQGYPLGTLTSNRNILLNIYQKEKASKPEDKELFTSGPWRADERDNPSASSVPFAIIKPINRGACAPIADICNFPPATKAQTNEQRANAFLIAAAPELYYVLKGIVEDCPEMYPQAIKALQKANPNYKP